MRHGMDTGGSERQTHVGVQPIEAGFQTLPTSSQLRWTRLSFESRRNPCGTFWVLAVDRAHVVVTGRAPFLRDAGEQYPVPAVGHASSSFQWSQVFLIASAILLPRPSRSKKEKIAECSRDLFATHQSGKQILAKCAGLVALFSCSL